MLMTVLKIEIHLKHPTKSNKQSNTTQRQTKQGLNLQQAIPFLYCRSDSENEVIVLKKRQAQKHKNP